MTLASALVAGPARAQQPASDGSTVLFREGVEHLRAGRHAEAVEAFRGSYRLSPRVTTMCNLALTYDDWGPEHREAAIRAYRTCAAEDASGRYRAHALERITAIERELVLEGGQAAEDVDPSASVDAADEPSDLDEPTGEVAALPADSGTPPTGGDDRGFLYASIGTGVLAAAALVTGVVLALDAQDRLAALQAEAPDGAIVRGSEQAQRLDAARAIAGGATAAYVALGVLAAAAAGLLTVDLVLASSGDEETATLRFTPVGVAGSF